MARSRRRSANWLKLIGVLCGALLIGVGLGVGVFIALRGPVLVVAPSLTGLSYADAASQTASSGFGLKTDPKQEISNEKDISRKKVISQAPGAGAVVEKGTTVTITLEPDKEVPHPTKHVVCLDPGHSAGAPSTEIDPETGLDVADNSGAAGEIQTNWDIAVKTKALLEQAGYVVKLTKPSVASNVNLKQRAAIGNSSEIMIRIHFDPDVHAVLFPGAGQTKSHGTSTMTVSHDISARSGVLANALFPYLENLGVTRIGNDEGGTSNNTGDAYVVSVLTKVPVALIENDPNMVRDNPAGQERVANAIVKGVNAYFNGL